MTKRKARKAPEDQAASATTGGAPESAVVVHDARQPVGRPTDYRPEYCEQAQKLYALGATDKEVADFFDINRSTLYRWQTVHPEFRDAAVVGKIPADDRVERSLYERGVGYTYDAVKIMQHEGRPVLVQHLEHVPPDPTAAFNWLKNRRPDAWRDRKELTGADGAPLPVIQVVFHDGADS